MDSNTDSNWARSQSCGNVARCRERPCRCCEAQKNPVAVGIYLHPAMARACLANDTSMLSQSFSVALGANLVQKSR